MTKRFLRGMQYACKSDLPKVAEALSPDKLKLMTSSGDALQALASGDLSAEAEGSMQLITELRDHEKKMRTTLPLIAALQDTKASCRAMVQALDDCEAANVKCTSALKEVCFQRATNAVFDIADFATWVALLKFVDDEHEGTKYNIHWTCSGDAKAAAALQDAQVMSRIVEVFRSADLTNEKAALANLHAFLTNVASVEILNADLKAPMADFIKFGLSLGSDGQFVGSPETTEIMQKIVEDSNHRLHKVVTLLPGGCLLLGRVQSFNRLRETDHKAEVALDKISLLVNMLKGYVRRENEKDSDHIDLALERGKYEEIQMVLRGFTNTVSEQFVTTHGDRISQVNKFLTDLGSNLQKRMFAFNVVSASPSFVSLNYAARVKGGKQVAYADAQAQLAEASSSTQKTTMLKSTCLCKFIGDRASVTRATRRSEGAYGSRGGASPHYTL